MRFQVAFLFAVTPTWVGLFLHFNRAAVIQLDDFAGEDFGGFAGFGCAVAAYAAFGDPGFGLAAAVGQAGEFEEVTQGDVFVAVEGEDLHGLRVSV